ncbi:MAG: hypothetical protein NC039_03880 [Muribaculaceae bacterium]|nr:hypothetical protein [Muribaculaceae bacterium]
MRIFDSGFSRLNSNPVINNITCTDADRAIVIKGLPEMNVQQITISNSIFEARNKSVINYASDVTLRNVKFTDGTENPIILNHSNNINLLP